MHKGALFLGTVIAVWMLASGPASAFQQVPTETEETPAPSVQPAPSADFSAPEPDEPEADSGFKLPGFDALGFLPKLDFGLDLMYGDSDSETTQSTPSRSGGPGDAPDDLSVMGTVRRRF